MSRAMDIKPISSVTELKDVDMIYSDEEAPTIDFPKLLAQVHSILSNCLQISICRKYKCLFGEEWESRIMIPLPWTLADIFRIINKDFLYRELPIELRHLNTISLETMAKDINRSVVRKSAMITKGDLTSFISNMESVLYICDDVGLTHDRIRAADLLQVIRNQLKYF